MTETIQEIEQEINPQGKHETIQAEFDAETGKIVEFHRESAHPMINQ